LSTEEPILQPSGRPEPLLTPTELPTTLPASVTPGQALVSGEQGFLPGRQEHWLLTETYRFRSQCRYLNHRYGRNHRYIFRPVRLTLADLSTTRPLPVPKTFNDINIADTNVSFTGGSNHTGYQSKLDFGLNDSQPVTVPISPI